MPYFFLSFCPPVLGHAEEFAEKMRILSELDDRDPEAAHSDGDDLLCDTLKKLGYAEGVELFEKMDKWYA